MCYSAKATLSILFGRWGPPTWKNYARREKKLAAQVFFLFFPPTCKKSNDTFIKKVDKNHREFVYFHGKKLTLERLFYFFLRCKPDRIFYFLFFFLWQGQKDPCRSSSSKQYTECCLICNIALFWRSHGWTICGMAMKFGIEVQGSQTPNTIILGQLEIFKLKVGQMDVVCILNKLCASRTNWIESKICGQWKLKWISFWSRIIPPQYLIHFNNLSAYQDGMSVVISHGVKSYFKNYPF